ncbi:MAG: hypothetical protein APF80_04900 [Alphaproteobacteria bacterium BRH_c36]|nr:MAG: hypothetical protein APF80_04900 [Alphaproteobacteria bacterium BRH_c36]
MTYSQANTAFAADVVPFPINSTRLSVYQPRHGWREKTKKRLEELTDLQQGWDGYNAEPVSIANAAFALSVLEAICAPDAAPPQLVPGNNRDLQIEWHTLRGDIELHVVAPNRVHAWRMSINDDSQEEDLELTTEFSSVAAWVKDMTEPDLAAETTAA